VIERKLPIEVCANRAVDSTPGVTGFSRPPFPGRLEISPSLRLVVASRYGSHPVVWLNHRGETFRDKPGDHCVKIKPSKHFDCTL